MLTESRLVTVDEGTVEVAHEALFREWPRLRGWLEEDAEGRRLHQHLIHAAAEWQGSGRDPAELYRGARLASALEWAAEHEREPNELERAFLEESRAASEREAERQRRTNRRLRTLLAGVGVLLAAAVVAGAIALSERQGARSAATVADSRRLAAQALTEERQDRALQLAGAGVALDDSVATRSSLLSTLVRGPPALGVVNTAGNAFAGTWTAALSPDGRTLASGDSDGKVILFDTATRERIGDYQAPDWVTGLDFHPRDGSLVIAAGVGKTGYLHVIDAATQRPRSTVSLGRHPAADPGEGYHPTATYAPDGRSVIVAYMSLFGPRTPLPVFMRRFDARDGSPIGSAVRVAPPVFNDGLHIHPGRAPARREPGGGLRDRRGHAARVTPLSGRRGRDLGDRIATGISADGATLALGGEDDGSVRLIDLASGRVETLRGAPEPGSAAWASAPTGTGWRSATRTGT